MFKVYLVGGIVRDELMGVVSHDRDFVVVGATERDMLAQGFKKVGADFPVFLNQDGDQYALARTERKTGTGYRGFSAVFDSSVTLEEDLSRRDLTVNAMAKDLTTGELCDPFNGRQDMANRVLRHVGPAFSEDPLRVVRLARFFARWEDFTVAPETFELAKSLVESGELNALSDERLWAEMDKMFKQSPQPRRFFDLLAQLGAFEHVNFFKDVLGDPVPEWGPGVDASANLEEAEKSAIFVALSARDAVGQNTPALPARIKSLTRNLRALRGLTVSGASVVTFLNSVRAFESRSMQFADVLLAMQAGEAARFRFPLEAEQLKQLREATGRIRASDFLSRGIEGAEVGRAMCSARIRVARALLGR